MHLTRVAGHLEVLRQLPRPCRGTACVEAHTVRFASVVVPLGDQAVRFEALVADDRHAVRRLDGRGGALEGDVVEVVGGEVAAGG